MSARWARLWRAMSFPAASADPWRCARIEMLAHCEWRARATNGSGEDPPVPGVVPRSHSRVRTLPLYEASSGGPIGERLLERASHPHAERVEDAARAVDTDVVVLVALVTRNLRLVHAEAVRELALRETERDA